MDRELVQIAVEKFIAARPSRPAIEEYAESLEAQGRVTPAVQEALDKARSVRLGHNVVFYIAGALTGMSDEVKQRYVDVSNFISETDAAMFGYAPHLYGTDPVRHPNITPEEVRNIDYLWAGIISDGHFNFWEPLAHGNAIEAGWAEQHGIPSLYLVPEGMTTSRLVRGMHNTIGTLVYSDFQADGLPQVQQFLNALQAQRAMDAP